MANDGDPGVSIDLRVQGRIKGAPGLGVGTAQHRGEQLPGVPAALVAPGNWNRGFSAPRFGAEPHPHLGGRSPVSHSHAEGSGEEIPRELNARLLLASSSAPLNPPALQGGGTGTLSGWEWSLGREQAELINPWLPFPSRGSCR